MTLIEPTDTGSVVRDGVRVGYDVYGDGDITVLLLPTWSIFPPSFWKAQVPYLARHYRVIRMHGRGTGRSDTPTEADAYTDEEFAADAVAVLDATDTAAAVMVALSCGATWGLRLAADHPSRVLGFIAIGPAVPLAPPPAPRAAQRLQEQFDAPVGWQKFNVHHWRTDYRDFVEFFMSELSSEPHSTKQIDDEIGWAMQISPEALVASTLGLRCFDAELVRELCARVTCPSLVVHGTDDRVRAFAQGKALAELLGGELLAVEGGAHDLMGRQPVLVNLAIRSFVERVSGSRGRFRRGCSS